MPHPWKRSRSGRTGLWATWSSWRCPCSSQGVLDEMTFKGPFQPKLFYDPMIHQLPCLEKPYVHNSDHVTTSDRFHCSQTSDSHADLHSSCSVSLKHNPFLCLQIKQDKISIPASQFTKINWMQTSRRISIINPLIVVYCLIKHRHESVQEYKKSISPNLIVNFNSNNALLIIPKKGK